MGFDMFMFGLYFVLVVFFLKSRSLYLGFEVVCICFDLVVLEFGVYY